MVVVSVVLAIIKSGVQTFVTGVVVFGSVGTIIVQMFLATGHVLAFMTVSSDTVTVGNRGGSNDGASYVGGSITVVGSDNTVSHSRANNATRVSLSNDSTTVFNGANVATIGTDDSGMGTSSLEDGTVTSVTDQTDFVDASVGNGQQSGESNNLKTIKNYLIIVCVFSHRSRCNR